MFGYYRFSFFGMGSGDSRVCRRCQPRLWWAGCRCVFRPPRQTGWLPLLWQVSVSACVARFQSSSSSLLSVWVAVVWCWQSSMRVVRERCGRRSSRRSGGISVWGSLVKLADYTLIKFAGQSTGRSSIDGWCYEKLYITTFMTSISLCKVGIPMLMVNYWLLDDFSTYLT